MDAKVVDSVIQGLALGAGVTLIVMLGLLAWRTWRRRRTQAQYSQLRTRINQLVALAERSYPAAGSGAWRKHQVVTALGRRFPTADTLLIDTLIEASVRQLRVRRRPAVLPPPQRMTTTRHNGTHDDE